MSAVAALFKALSDRTRLRILALLVGGEICVCDIHDSLRLPQPRVSRHLANLRRAGLVETRRNGLWIYYRLARLDDTVLHTLTDIVTHALGHVETIARDVSRLRGRTGRSDDACCVPETSPRPSLACCQQPAANAMLSDDPRHEPLRSPRKMALRIEPAEPVDAAAIERLLVASHLPIDGLREWLGSTLVIRQNGRIVACAALELYPSGALLRSVAVDEGIRGQGVGRQVIEAALALARRHGAIAAFLLTTTAADYFPRFGFSRVDRAAVPDDVCRSVEFTSACPATAVAMRAGLGRLSPSSAL